MAQLSASSCKSMSNTKTNNINAVSTQPHDLISLVHCDRILSSVCSLLYAHVAQNHTTLHVPIFNLKQFINKILNIDCYTYVLSQAINSCNCTFIIHLCLHETQHHAQQIAKRYALRFIVWQKQLIFTRDYIFVCEYHFIKCDFYFIRQTKTQITQLIGQTVGHRSKIHIRTLADFKLIIFGTFCSNSINFRS